VIGKKRLRAAIDALEVVEMFRGVRRLYEIQEARRAGTPLPPPPLSVMLRETASLDLRERALGILTDKTWGPMSAEYRLPLLDLAPDFVEPG
jgi:hypothetical protein